MRIEISADAEQDLTDGFWFYERQSVGLGNYFRSCLIADIDSLEYFAGVHEVENGYHRALSKRFPIGIYYSCLNSVVTIVAVLDLRREPSWIRDRLDPSSTKEP
jgi:plasmid stabilization system protein ParE